MRLIKAREVRRTEYVTYGKKKRDRDAYSVFMDKPEKRASLGKPSSRWYDYKNVFKELDVAWTGLIWLRLGGRLAGWLAGFYEHGNEPAGFIT
jgi:hypothetical protein